MASTAAETSTPSSEPTWGRVLLTGGTDWPSLGRKGDKGGAVGIDVNGPHIVRALANVKITSIHSSCSAVHFVCIDIDGNAHLFGRNFPVTLGPSTLTADTYIPETQPKCISPASLGAPEGTRFVSAFLGKSTTFLVGSDGGLWSCGENKQGQCGIVGPASVEDFMKVDGDWAEAKVVGGAAGGNFAIIMTDEGKLYACGSTEHGQLANGRTGEYIVSAGRSGFESVQDPALIGGALTGKKVVEVACGTSHTLARTEDGYVYAWGFGGYCRLGLQDQKNCLVPTILPQFARDSLATRAKTISCGPSSSTVVDNQSMYMMAGKWKTSGDGSGGSPYSVYKYIADIMSCKVWKASSGFVTHFALALDQDDPTSTLVCAWGQSAANGELGLGEGEPKSATKPLRVELLNGIKLLDVACGAHTTLFLAVPNERMSELPRHPDLGDSVDSSCAVCHVDRGETDEPLACDVCDQGYHIGCLDPPLSEVPTDPEWFCPQCDKPVVPDQETGKVSNKRKAGSSSSGGAAASKKKK